MKTLCVIISLLLIPTTSFSATQKMPNLTIDQAQECVAYGEFVAHAAKIRDKGKDLPSIMGDLKSIYPTVDEVYLYDAVKAIVGFKKKTPDWIGGFITGKCVGLIQGSGKSSKYIEM